MIVDLKDLYDKFENELRNKLVGKNISVKNAPKDLTEDLSEHTGVVKHVNLFTYTYDSSAKSRVVFEDGNEIYLNETTEVEIKD